jgi:hypothetical protein
MPATQESGHLYLYQAQAYQNVTSNCFDVRPKHDVKLPFICSTQMQTTIHTATLMSAWLASSKIQDEFMRLWQDELNTWIKMHDSHPGPAKCAYARAMNAKGGYEGTRKVSNALWGMY